jgi:hypothetical protein
MIILITYLDKETNTKMVSHGYNVTTDELVVLPSVPLFYFGDAKFDSEVGEYILTKYE